MKIRVLGCHGSHHLLQEEDGIRICRPCGLLINDTVLLDAGTIASALSLEEQRKIRFVLLSHLHFDHIQGLPTLADNLSDDHPTGVTLCSIPEVLQGLQSHIFNDSVYPDFTKLPDASRTFFKLMPLGEGQEIQIGDLRVQAIPVNHSVPTVGFLIEDATSAFVYSGDTYETEALWKEAKQHPHLKAVFIESSFPNRLSQLAKRSFHLTPSLLAGEYKKLGKPQLPVYAYHLKPRYRNDIIRELRLLGIPQLSILEEGQEIQV